MLKSVNLQFLYSTSLLSQSTHSALYNMSHLPNDTSPFYAELLSIYHSHTDGYIREQVYRQIYVLSDNICMLTNIYLVCYFDSVFKRKIIFYKHECFASLKETNQSSNLNICFLEMKHTINPFCSSK